MRRILALLLLVSAVGCMDFDEPYWIEEHPFPSQRYGPPPPAPSCQAPSSRPSLPAATSEPPLAR